MYATGAAFIEALYEAGVSHIFANFGSDHPSIIEALAEFRATGRPAPKVITCPNEMVALSAAQGFAQVSGRAQAVIVHVDCGTQAIAGALHNAAKARIPVLIFAGASPFTQEGELRGSRNEFIHWIQDVSDQQGIVRGYVKYNNEIRTGRNVKQMVFRALQFASSDPKGPVYLMGAREVMEEEIPPVQVDRKDWPAIAPAALPSSEVPGIVDDLVRARRPLVVTSYLGRNKDAVGELIRLCDRLAIGVIESVPNYVNFPTDNPMYQGCYTNDPQQNAVLGEADYILLMDSDIPWIPLINRPSKDAKITHIDIDPIKEQMPLWQIPTRHSFRADAETALRQLNEQLVNIAANEAIVEERRSHYASQHTERRSSLLSREQPTEGVITPEHLTACIRQHLEPDSIVLNEAITNFKVIVDHLCLTRPGSMITAGGGSLGWSGGAAIGAKLAQPDRLAVAVTGDGSYMFSVPSSVHWIARRYKTPFLQVIYNNCGWKSPKLSTLAVHPSGYASKAKDIDVAFDPPPDYAGIATAAGGAFGRTVRRPEELNGTIEDALKAVREEHRCAVLDVWLPHL
jgi:acetolactate synthase I/II/III large subunit